MINNVSIIVKCPQGDERMTLGVRTAYAAQSGGYTTSLVLIKHGIFNLIGILPGYLRDMMAGFVENEGRLYYLDSCLAQNGLTAEEIKLEGVQPISKDDLADLIDESDAVNVY